MYGLLAREHGWTYETIGKMDLDEFFEAIETILEYRKKIFPVDVTLQSLKKVLFEFMGVKEQPKLNEKSLNSYKIPHFTFTEEQKEKWIAAGMPNPSKFFNKKIKKKRK